MLWCLFHFCLKAFQLKWLSSNCNATKFSHLPYKEEIIILRLRTLIIWQYTRGLNAAPPLLFSQFWKWNFFSSSCGNFGVKCFLSSFYGAIAITFWHAGLFDGNRRFFAVRAIVSNFKDKTNCLVTWTTSEADGKKHFILNYGLVLFFKTGLLRKQGWENDSN